MKIVLSGGGTLGPVTPLLAIAETYKKVDSQTEFIWVGTERGPEKAVVEKYGLPFFIIGAGKWRRYFSWSNFWDIFKIIIAFFQSILFLLHEKPHLLISTGGFVSVPLHYAGAFLGIPSWIHQQDVRPGLANKVMARVAKKITTSLKESVKFFPFRKTEWIGNPTRELKLENKKVAYAHFNIPTDAEAVIFALGGGTGSEQINNMILQALPSWPKNWHVIHLTGKERSGRIHREASKTFSNYHVFDFFTSEMNLAYSAADIVVARSGFGTLGELALFSKAAIIVPMPGTHQEENANYLVSQNGIIKFQEGANGIKLAYVVSQLIHNVQKRVALGKQLHTLLPKAETEKIVSSINELIGI